MPRSDDLPKSAPARPMATSRHYHRAAWLSAVALSAALPFAATAQPPGPPPGPLPGAELMFNASVKRTFDTRCVACHGPARQQGGLRLDSREAFLRGGASGAAVAPFDRGKSRLYSLVAAHKMPLDAPLSLLEIEALGAWIDQGANWPAAKRAATANPDPRVDAYHAAITNADRRAVARLVRQPGFAAARGKGGSTALHYAALFGTPADIAALIDAGAAIDAPNDRGVTPLLWAFSDPAKVRLLVDRGANPNAAADDGATPLVVAASQSGGAELLRYLAAKGARPDPSTMVMLFAAAASTGDVEMVLAVTPGLMPPAGPLGEQAMTLCYLYNSRSCEERLTAAGVRGAQLSSALVAAAGFGDAAQVRDLLARGAPTVSQGAPQGITALMAAVASDAPGAAEKVQLLLAAGADPNAAGTDGRTPLFYARQRHPDLVPVLIAKGAK